MADEKTPGNVVSMSGSPIWRHGDPAPFRAPGGDESIGQVSAHIEAHLGPIETVFHEIVSDAVHIDVHFVPANERCPHIRLVTSGMSDLPMATPDDPEIPRFAELMITLPAGWRVDEKSFEDEAWYWPVRLIKMLARLPHLHATWLGWGHTVAHGDPPAPYAANTRQCGAIVLPSVTVPGDFARLRLRADKEIAFFAAVPLYQAEMDLKMRSGIDELLARFSRHGIDDVVDTRRRDVAKKRFGFW